jgi:EAL domain-containing protein (putative c-di-GMP-specific phosphodiesterase class I)
MMQGYYFGRPMTAEKFEDILRTKGTAYKEKDER